MNKQHLLRTLDSHKLHLFGNEHDLNSALANAYMQLPESHVHDINQAIDVYHNTLINHLMMKIDMEWNDADVPNVH